MAVKLMRHETPLQPLSPHSGPRSYSTPTFSVPIAVSDEYELWNVLAAGCRNLRSLQ